MSHTEKTIKNLEIDIVKKGERVKVLNDQIHRANLEKEFIEKYIVDATATIGKLKA